MKGKLSIRLNGVKSFEPEMSVFAGGEVNVCIPDRKGYPPSISTIVIEAQIQDSEMLIALLLLVDAAKGRDYNFDLTEKQFFTFWQKPCYYCGSPNETIGLDRVDNTQGYSLSNVVPCCTHCNKMKLDLTIEDFYDKLLKIVKHLNLKGEIKCQ